MDSVTWMEQVKPRIPANWELDETPGHCYLLDETGSLIVFELEREMFREMVAEVLERLRF